jgi:hypothetical protein
MGIINSIISRNDNNNLIDKSTINVSFIHIAKNSNCNVTVDELNNLLGLYIPKYSILEGTNFPYLFCVNIFVDINNILKEYGYDIGFCKKQKVLKKQYNANHRAIMSYDNNECYKLEYITNL